MSGVLPRLKLNVKKLTLFSPCGILKMSFYIYRFAGWGGSLKNLKTQNIFRMLAAFFIPAAAMLLVYACMGVYPFGGRSLLCNDLQAQYVSFFSYLKGVWGGGNSLFYSMSKTLGGDLAGFSAYYLLSPFNLIFLFVPVTAFTEAIAAITLMKIGACGASMFFFLQHEQKGGDALIFSTAYALCAYNIVYQSNLMWLDGVILLPLIMLGLRCVVKERRFLLYTTTLALAVILNYYIGFMLCLFSVIMFVCFLVTENIGRKQILPTFAVFAGASAVAGGLSAAVLLPAVSSLSGGKFNGSVFQWKSNFSLSAAASRLLPGSFDGGDIVSGLPNLFCGTLIVMLCVCYFLAPSIHRKEKLASGGVLLVLLFSMKYYVVNLFWHGLNEPVWFPYRYSFLFSFFVILLARRGLLHLTKKRFWFSCAVSGGFIALICALTFFMKYSSGNKKGIMLAVAAAGLACLLCRRLCEKKSALALCLLLLFGCGEMVCNAYFTLTQFPYADRASFVNIVKDKSSTLESIKKSDPGIYRIESYHYGFSYNDPMLFGYYGLSHYSSSEKQAVTDFMKKMGYQDNNVYAYYSKGSTAAADSFLGMKYFLTRDEPARPYPHEKQGDVNVYRNSTALPLAFLAQPEAAQVSAEQNNLFTLQNDLWKAMTGDKKDVFAPVEYEESLVNLKKESRDGAQVYTKLEAGEAASITYSFRASDSRMIYAYFPSDELHCCELIVNGESRGNTFSGAHHNMIIIGSFQPGESVSLELKLTESTVVMNDVFFRCENQDVLEEYSEKLKQNPVKLHGFGTTHVRAEFSNDEDKLLIFTVPQDDAWEICLDGKEVEQIKLLDTLLSVEVPGGTHELEMKYHPKGLAAGVCASAVSLLVSVFWLAVSAKKRKK